VGSVLPRPSSWTFTGWMAYRLFGPRARDGFASVLWELEDGAKIGCSLGRSDARQDAKIVPDPDRGRTRNDRIVQVSEKDLVVIAQVENRTVMKNAELDLAAMETMLHANGKEIDQLLLQLKMEGNSVQETIELKSRLKVIRNEIDEIKSNIKNKTYKTKQERDPMISQFLKKNNFVDLTDDK